jgi:hypothetical protein
MTKPEEEINNSEAINNDAENNDKNGIELEKPFKVTIQYPNNVATDITVVPSTMGAELKNAVMDHKLNEFYTCFDLYFDECKVSLGQPLSQLHTEGPIAIKVVPGMVFL